MIFNFFNASKRATAAKRAAEETSHDEVLHPVIADLIIAQERRPVISSHERDYGVSRAPVRMPVAFV